ncbi:hypothetical protein GCM10010497_37760 [Streptomyces cinereoruber]|uniref:Uncharacterized protein n=1 Tax=Streptomyces cinereoruber TaxID=67260 RepID=A0AAV4KM44_9ACTN|nr:MULTISPECIES: hypothetical protein [Streptomyces]AVH96641.1 hypothetical protein C5L38_17500 [Streptomyces sp. WAC00288]KYG55276.1 hypothetical protein AWI43_13210 [Streptomyces sp. WAC04657]MBB4159919.1 hypothetical protein [Streptomyces cinereoruber]MBY8817719.1 hypothetical protein [Streptomyces cinereoruber]NIH60627.1 hypothetical protein [Streptomyces cinereoruber]
MRYCERHEMHNCADCAPRTPRGGAPAGVWDGWPAAAIIVHAGGKAHLPGCRHIEPADVRPPHYGWVPAPSAGAWRRLSPSDPLRATHGNTERVAVSRCMSCDASQ